jgi:hypothetical protein
MEAIKILYSNCTKWRNRGNGKIRTFTREGDLPTMQSRTM